MQTEVNTRIKTNKAEIEYITEIHKDMADNGKHRYTNSYDFTDGDRVKITVEIAEQIKIEGEKVNKTPLTESELRELAGKPVYCYDMDTYGIVKYETKGRWAGVPFLIGAWHSNGVATNFEYDILKRGLKCYKVDTEYT